MKSIGRISIGFLLVLSSFFVGGYSGVLSTGYNPHEKTVVENSYDELRDRHKAILENDLRLSKRQWSGHYESSGYGSLMISENKGFHLGERIVGCFGFPAVVGKVKVSGNTLILSPYPTFYNGYISDEIAKLSIVKYSGKYYLVPQESHNQFQKNVHHLEHYCNEASPQNKCAWVFEKKS